MPKNFTITLAKPLKWVNTIQYRTVHKPNAPQKAKSQLFMHKGISVVVGLKTPETYNLNIEVTSWCIPTVNYLFITTIQTKVFSTLLSS